MDAYTFCLILGAVGLGVLFAVLVGLRSLRG